MGAIEDPKTDIGAPRPLTASHDVSGFDSGVPVLDDWLRQRALKNQDTGASRTFVVCAKDRVVGYYCLASGSVAVAGAPGRVRRNMPDPIPVMVLGRLAVDSGVERHGVGSALLRDAILRTIQAAEIGGIRAILVHALSKHAKEFYEHHGFYESPVDPMTLMVTLEDAKRSLGGTR